MPPLSSTARTTLIQNDKKSGLAVAVGAFGVYVATVAPGIPGGDAGELVAESCQLGTAHPPGYPLFTLINHMTTLVLPG
ncbi:unnamed protein product, partial [Hapterophycus canaliculatus]